MNIFALLFSGILLCSSWAHAQHVGINNPNPTEALDVNGNIQLNGSIVANGSSGQSGQALFSTGSGMQWLDAISSEFKRFRSYVNTTASSTNSTWQKPVGVTEVLVESWAGGGGGSGGGGGAGGGYAAIIIDVSQTTQINLTIGQGGNSNTTAVGEDGGNTVVSWSEGASNYSVTVPGGRGGSNSGAGASNPLFVQNISATTSLFTIPGNPGAPIRTFYAENASATYATLIDGGRGGGTFKFYHNGGAGINYAVTSSNTALLTNRAAGGGTPGGGGGSSSRITSVTGNRGGGGLVIIRW